MAIIDRILGGLRIELQERDAEIARLRAEVEQMARWLRDTERLCGEATTLAKKTEADLAAHKRALAAGPAALRALCLRDHGWQDDPCPAVVKGSAVIVEAAQEAAMKEGT